jgi:hypothetical protein
MENDGSRAYHRTFADFDTGQDNSTDADVSVGSNSDAAAKRDAGRNVRVIADEAVMLDDGARVDDAILADCGSMIHDCSGHDHGTGPDHGRGSGYRGGVNQYRGQESFPTGTAETAGADSVVAHRNRKPLSNKAGKRFGAADDQAVAAREADLSRVIVDQHEGLKQPGCAGDIKNNSAMPPDTPNQ